MIINPNLHNGVTIITLTPMDVANRFESIFIDQIGLKDGNKFTVSLDLELNGSEQATVILFDKNYSVITDQTIFTNGKRNSYTFTFNSKKTHRIACYAGIQGKTNNVWARFSKIKVEEGDKATLYIPNANSLSADKQAILTKGGYLQRFIQSSAKKGGGLC